MGEKMEIIAAYAYSLVTYSCFQLCDILSTRAALSKLTIEKHEVNPLLVWLKRKVGTNRAFFLMWLVIANSVALFDALYVQAIVGFVLACYFFGMFHLFAVFNNLQIFFETKFVGPENLERNTDFLIGELKKRSTMGKIVLLTKLNLFNIFVSFFGIATLVLSTMLLNTLQFSLTGPTSVFLMFFPPMMIITLILFAPFKVMGMFIICTRRLQTKSPENPPADQESVTNLPVSVLEKALKDAKENHSTFVQIRFSPTEPNATSPRQSEVKKDE
jgi:hypothetical protein